MFKIGIFAFRIGNRVSHENYRDHKVQLCKHSDLMTVTASQTPEAARVEAIADLDKDATVGYSDSRSREENAVMQSRVCPELL